MKLQRRTVAVISVATAVLCLAVVGVVIWRVEKALIGSRRDTAASELLGVEVRAVGTQPNSGFEGITSPAIFKSAAAFQGRIYLSGPAGLSVYATDGTLERFYRVGIDLPTAPLGQLAVGTLADSRQPELLIATLGEGVLAFDGSRFRQIRATQDEARVVTALLPVSSGRLLIGTAKLGLLIFDGKALKKFHATTNDVYVTSLAGSEAELWVGTLNDGLLYWHGGQTERIGEGQGLPDRRVDQIALDDGRVYVGTPMGVAEMRDGKILRQLAKGRYAHALLAEGDSLLVGQVDAGVMRVSLSGNGDDGRARRPIVARVAVSVEDPHAGRAIDGNSGRATVEQFLAVGDSRYALASDGLLTLETDGQWQWVLGRRALRNSGSQLTDSNISALMVGSDGRLWVGYFDRGLDILNAAGGAVTHVENEHVFCVNRIVEDARHASVAVATANGLVLFDNDGRQKQVLGREAGLIAEHVTDVALYGDGMALATPAGITFLDNTGAHSLYAFQGLVNNHVYALGAGPDQASPDRTGQDQLVAGTLGGLSLLTGGQIRRNLTTATSGLKHNWITGLAAVGNDWLVGTYGAGVLRLGADGKITSTEATRTGVVVNPTAMVADGRVVLAGTLGQGLLVGDASGTRWRTVSAGLPSLNVTALAIRNGQVYVGTENGLVKISEDRLQ
jgi:ligand-binding sensor domain-containing protein